MSPVLEQSHLQPAEISPDPLICGIERVVAAILLCAVAPVAIVIAITILVLSRRSPLIRHARIGWRGQPLLMLKFRTMWGAEPASSTSCMKCADDPRITSRFAAFCRRHSLDELPQLLHVVRGEMSIIGPRPITAGELDEYYGSSAQEILSVRPGLTGLWQVRGRSRLSYARRRRLDSLLVRRGSLRLRLYILRRSIGSVFTGRDAW